MRGFVTAQEFADKIGVSLKTFSRMVSVGQIPQPMPRVAGGKRFWSNATVSEIVGDEAA